jgi:hypothetical protein
MDCVLHGGGLLRDDPPHSTAIISRGRVWKVASIGSALKARAILEPIDNAVAANNSSWGWNFAKAFFGGLVSAAGWKAVYHSTVDEGGCDRLMFETFAEGFNPLPSEGPDVGTALEVGPKAVAQAGRAAASAYSLYQGLSELLDSLF